MKIKSDNQESGKVISTKIITCDCINEFQDALYGKFRRVCNPTTKRSGDNILYRCTVCGKERYA